MRNRRRTHTQVALPGSATSVRKHRNGGYNRLGFNSLDGRIAESCAIIASGSMT